MNNNGYCQLCHRKATITSEAFTYNKMSILKGTVALDKLLTQSGCSQNRQVDPSNHTILGYFENNPPK